MQKMSVRSIPIYLANLAIFEGSWISGRPKRPFWTPLRIVSWGTSTVLYFELLIFKFLRKLKLFKNLRSSLSFCESFLENADPSPSKVTKFSVWSQKIRNVLKRMQKQFSNFFFRFKKFYFQVCGTRFFDKKIRRKI